MADAERTTGAGSRRQPPTRLQRRAPASIQISRPSNWNVAIPLLSPLVSPSSSDQADLLMADNKPREEARSLEQRHRRSLEMEKAPTFAKWQHPAAPFYYGPVPRATPFVPV